jgi:hypothetical protein
MPVSFEELEGSPRIVIGEDGTEAARLFRVAWNDWPAFARELVGSYQLVAGQFHFQKPLEFPGMPNLVVADLAIEPLLPSTLDGSQVTSLRSGTNRYTSGGALVRATYRTQFDVSNQPIALVPSVPAGTYLTYKADLAGEFISTPARIWRWNNPPQDTLVPPDMSPGIFVPHGRFELIWHRVASPPWSKIRDLRGKVNDAAFVGAPAGTVLFAGARALRQFHFSPEGGFWRLHYVFEECTKELASGGKAGWNFFYKETAVGGEHWVEIRDEDGNRPYKSGNLAALFQFG